MSATVIYKPNITNSHLAHFVHSKYYFSQSGYKAFYSYTIEKAMDMLPKRSTPVDQIFWFESTHSQLSVAIFIASRNLLGLGKVLYTKKKCQNGSIQKQPPLWLHFGAICRDVKFLFHDVWLFRGCIHMLLEIFGWVSIILGCLQSSHIHNIINAHLC